MSKKNKSPPVEVVVWNRLFAGEIAGAIDADIDEAKVTELLAQRWTAKLEKNFSLADEIAATIRSMNVVYHDDTKSWYTRVATESQPTRPVVVRRTREQERNRRQAEKNRRNKLKKEAESDGKVSEAVAVDANPAKKKRI